MLLFNSLFWPYFGEGSKGILFQIKLFPHNIPQEKLRNYLEELIKLTNQKKEAISSSWAHKELYQNAKWLVIPRELSQKDKEEILSKVGDWFMVDTSSLVKTLWIDRMIDIGLYF